MPIVCQTFTSGGKGNLGMFIERDRQICAAGMPTAQPEAKMADYLQHYLMQEEAEALIRDSIQPPKPPRKLPPLRRRPNILDKRNAVVNTDVNEVVFPRVKTKYQVIAEDLKNTVYASYWKPTGQSKDPVPMMPVGFDKETTFGKTVPRVPLYDVVLPKVPLPDATPASKRPPTRTNRNYCEPYNPNACFGHKPGIDKGERLVKKCLTDPFVAYGKTAHLVTVGCATYLQSNHPETGKCLAPCNNINSVPEGHTFGAPSNISPIISGESYTYCKLNPEREFIKRCVGHINSVKKCLSVKFLPELFLKFYLTLRHLDTNKSGWLPKDIVYDECTKRQVRFNPELIEPLLALWKAIDGSRIEYKTFLHVLNFKHRTPDLPKIPDMEGCIDYRTTYTEFSKPQCPDVRPRAGVPSGRYLDRDYPVTPNNYCRADRAYLPEESDVKSCLDPSVFTTFNVSHRDMYARRDPSLVRKVFENTGEEFTDDSFKEIWEEAAKYHSQGWVSFETFRKALIKIRGTI